MPRLLQAREDWQEQDYSGDSCRAVNVGALMPKIGYAQSQHSDMVATKRLPVCITPRSTHERKKEGNRTMPRSLVHMSKVYIKKNRRDITPKDDPPSWFSALKNGPTKYTHMLSELPMLHNNPILKAYLLSRGCNCTVLHPGAASSSCAQQVYESIPCDFSFVDIQRPLRPGTLYHSQMKITFLNLPRPAIPER